MTTVAVFTAAGSSGATTTALLLASSMPAGQAVLLAECDPSGGDVAAWAELRDTPGWATAVAAGDRSWSGLQMHTQQLPSGLHALVAPVASAQAEVVVRGAADRFGSLLRALSEVIVISDCGRMTSDAPSWVLQADFALVVLRQSEWSATATVARVDRTRAAAVTLQERGVPVEMLLIGARPYSADELVSVVGCEMFAGLPEDARGASMVSGGWAIGRGASRSPLARAARPLGGALAERLATQSTVVPLRRSEDDDEVAG